MNSAPNQLRIEAIKARASTEERLITAQLPCLYLFDQSYDPLLD